MCYSSLKIKKKYIDFFFMIIAIMLFHFSSIAKFINNYRSVTEKTFRSCGHFIFSYFYIIDVSFK